MNRIFGLASGSAISVAFAGHAMAATLIATPDNVYDRVKAAQKGDVVQLQSGTYTLDLWALRKPGEVVVTPAPGAKVVATTINTDDSEFLTFRGIDVRMTPRTQYGLEVHRAHDITFDGLTIKGADCKMLNGLGVMFRALPDKSNVVLKNSDISCLGSGIAGIEVDGVTIEHNNLHDLQTDGMILTGTSNMLIKDNTGNSFHTEGGGHPDFIQWANAGGVTSSNLKIIGNRFERGTGDLVQGIFGEDGSNVVIQDNILFGTMYHGIAVNRTQTFTVSHNFVQSQKGDQGTWIMIRQQAKDGVVSNNATPQMIIGVSNEPQPTNVKVTGTTTTKPGAPGDYSQLTAWQAKTGKGG
jgi:hypothetical protein